MRMHVGARGGEAIMEHFHQMLDVKTQSPENLLANIKAINEYANEVQNQGPRSKDGSPYIDIAQGNGAVASPFVMKQALRKTGGNQQAAAQYLDSLGYK